MFGSIIPEPLAIPPTRKFPAGVSTSTEASLGNGSVVMIATAASPPPVLASAADALVMPLCTFVMSSFTPMTPVDATSTAFGSHPRAVDVSAVMLVACARPSGPVHAFAQPLFTTTAVTRPPEAASCSRDTMTGAAIALFVVKTAAALAVVSETINARSSPPFALMPHATPAARKPCGAVIPPLMAHTLLTRAPRARLPSPGRAPSTAPAGAVRRSAGVRLPCALHRSGPPAARVSTWTPSRSGSVTAYWPQCRKSGHAVQSWAIFSGTHTCGTIVKPSLTKCEGWCVNAHSVANPRAAPRRRELRDQPRPNLVSALVLVNDERPDFGHGAAERRELRAGDHHAVAGRDNEAGGVIVRFPRSCGAAGAPIRDCPRSAG